jgi:Phosphotransferase enzyme family
MAQQLADTRSTHVRARGTLPLLQTVLDVDVMRASLGETSPTADGGGFVVSSARLIDCKKGHRGVIAYELERPPGGERFRVLGKHFGDPVQAKRVREIHLSLWSHVFRGATRLGVPEPFGWLPDLSLVLYLPVKGGYLDRAILAGRDDALRQAAQWLARLHESRLRLDRRLDLGNELVNVGKWADLVGAAYPEEALAAARISKHLRDRANTIQLEPTTPIHKDFHYRHVVVGQRLAVLDFDEMRQGDPSFDLAHFCTYLYLLCIRQGWPRSRFRTLERTFLDAYTRRSGWVRDDRFAYFAAYTCLKIARQLCLNVGVPPRPTGAERRRQLRAILEHGHALGASPA